MDIIIIIALIILCVIGVILMKTGIDMQTKKEGLEHRRDLYKIWSGHYPEEKEEQEVRKVCHRNNINGLSQRRIEMLEEKLKRNR